MHVLWDFFIGFFGLCTDEGNIITLCRLILEDDKNTVPTLGLKGWLAVNAVLPLVRNIRKQSHIYLAGTNADKVFCLLQGVTKLIWAMLAL